MSLNSKLYNQQIRTFTFKTGTRIELVTKMIAFKVWNSVTLRTPVDTGRARASWFLIRGEDGILQAVPEEGFRQSSARGRTTREAAGAKAQAAAAGRIQLGGVIPVYTIGNNVEYIEYLENGRSAQAPLGMMKLAIAEVIAEINTMVIKAKSDVP